MDPKTVFISKICRSFASYSSQNTLMLSSDNLHPIFRLRALRFVIGKTRSYFMRYIGRRVGGLLFPIAFQNLTSLWSPPGGGKSKYVVGNLDLQDIFASKRAHIKGQRNEAYQGKVGTIPSLVLTLTPLSLQYASFIREPRKKLFCPSLHSIPPLYLWKSSPNSNQAYMQVIISKVHHLHKI